jgi:Copper transport outer membrane protein, MctB
VIDFRYHLVSIIAVFMALAVGLLLGSTYLSGYVEDALRAAQKSLTKENGDLRTQNGILNNQVAAGQAFAQAGAAQLLAPGGNGLLAGQKVVLVEAGADSPMTSGVLAALRQAGAVPTGEVLLQPAFFQSSGQTESTLSQKASQLAGSAGATLPASPLYPAVAGQQDAAAVIAASIVSKTGTGLQAAANKAVLSGFANGGFLQVTNLIHQGASTLSPATLAIVLTPPGTPPQQTTSEALVAVAAQLRPASLGTVMAGSVNAIASGSAISLEGSSGAVSTVDNADTEIGQIMVAQALRELVSGKAPAAYGVGPGTAPSPAPTPVPTAPASPSASISPNAKHT